jgi:hypothetical protein
MKGTIRDMKAIFVAFRARIYKRERGRVKMTHTKRKNTKK